MTKVIRRVLLGLLVTFVFAHYVNAQTVTYHLHKEASTTSGLFQLKTAGPDGTTLAIQSANLKNSAVGEYLIKAFDTQSGVPNASGVIPAGSTITFTLWMNKTSTSGVIFPRAKLRLNNATGTLFCTATGSTALTTTLTRYTVSGTTSSNISMTTADRFYVWVGVNVTTVATSNTNAVMNVEGTLNGNYDSLTIIPTPTPPPAISNLSVTSGAVGTPVTINGSNFGATQGTSTVTFNGTAATPTSWSATSVAVPVPAGATTGPVVVTVNGQASNGVTFTVTPKINSLSPTSGAVNTSVTISGTTFGATQGTSIVTFNGTAATPTSWSATSIGVPVPAAATTGAVVVTVNGQASNGVTFTVTPKINTLSPTSGVVNTSVTVSGTTFGATQGTSTVTFNGTTATPTSWSATSIAVPVPAAATTGAVVVTVNGQASNGVTFTVTPKIDSLSPTSGPVNTSVTISGATFGATQGTSTVTLNGTAATPTSWSVTSIAVPVPAGATTGPVVVTVNGQASNGVTFTVTPSINNLSPTFGPINASITINGSTFGATQGAGTVTFNGTAATPTSWSATSIAAPVPAGATTGPVVVTVNGQASNGVTFTLTPGINSLSPISGVADTSITISGTSFGATQGTSTVTFNGTAATPSSWSTTSIAVAVPAGATTGPVVVTVNGQASNGVAFTVTTPGTVSGKVTRADGTTPISGATVKALQGATTLATTVTNGTGDYSLPPVPQGPYTIQASAAGYGTKNQNLVAVNGGATTTVNLSLDAIVTGPISYIYDASGRLISTVGPAETVTYNYDAVGNLLSISRQSSSQLSIINVVPNSGAVGTAVTINGSGFSSVANENSVQFNGVAAAITSATTTQIVTAVPSVGVTGLIQIAVTTPGGTVTAPFTVLPTSTQPSIQVTPGSISIAPGDRVQFAAVVGGLTGDQSVTWSVNGVFGGNSTIGTISSTGFYASGTQPSATSIYTIRATSVANPSVFGQAQVAVLNSSYAEAVIAHSISVLRALITSAVTAPQVSIRKNAATVVSGITAASVSIRKNSLTISSAPTSATVSVRRVSPTLVFGSTSPSVSLTKGPYIQSLSPASGSQSTNFTMTITGVNLLGVTGVKFITSAGAIDSNVTASNIVVDGDGTSLTATVTIGASAALGPRIVVVTSSANHSLAVDVGSNIIQVVQ